MCVYWSDFAFVMQKILTGGLPRHPFQQGTILVEKIWFFSDMSIFNDIIEVHALLEMEWTCRERGPVDVVELKPIFEKSKRFQKQYTAEQILLDLFGLKLF